MADKKITQLDAVTSVANTDLLLIVRDPSTTPANKKLEIGDLFGETAQTVFSKVDVRSTGNSTLAAASTQTVSGNAVRLVSNTTVEMTGTPDVIGDRIRIRSSFTPANSNNTFVGLPVGTIAWDSNYLYIAVASGANGIARIAANTAW